MTLGQIKWKMLQGFPFLWQTAAGWGTSFCPSTCLSVGEVIAERRKKNRVMYINLEIPELHGIILTSVPLGC